MGRPVLRRQGWRLFTAAFGAAIGLRRYVVQAQGRPMMESEVPPGLRSWLGRDRCGSAPWSTTFYDGLGEVVGHFNGMQFTAALSRIAQLIAPVLSDPWVAFDCATAVSAALQLGAQCADQLQLSLLAARMRQEAAVFGSFDFQMKGEDFIDQSPWPIVWADGMQNILRSMFNLKQREQSAEPWRTLPLRRALHEGFAGTSPPASAIQKRLRVAIVSVCDYDAGLTPLATLSRINKEAYAWRHGYDVIMYEKAPVFDDPLSSLLTEPASHRPAAWSKVDAVLTSLANGRHDWVMWMDCDSFFMDPDLRLEDIIAASDSAECESDDKTKLDDLVREWLAGPQGAPLPRGRDALLAWYDDLFERHRNSELASLGEAQKSACRPRTDRTMGVPINRTLGWDDWLLAERRLHLLASEDGLMLNTGNVLVRASMWSWQFFQKVRWMTFGKSPVTQHPWWEQTAMVYLLQLPFTLEHISLLGSGAPPRDLEVGSSSSLTGGNAHAPACRMLAQRHLNTYPPLVASALATHEAFEPGDFIVSFSGCKIYSSQETCNELFLSHFFAVHDVRELEQDPALKHWL